MGGGAAKPRQSSELTSRSTHKHTQICEPEPQTQTTALQIQTTPNNTAIPPAPPHPDMQIWAHAQPHELMVTNMQSQNHIQSRDTTTYTHKRTRYANAGVHSHTTTNADTPSHLHYTDTVTYRRLSHT